MREIEFRGKRKDISGQECEWIYGSYLNPRDSCAAHFIADREIPGLTEVIPITVGQYTGMKDKNGAKIYEGDVLKFSWMRGFHPVESFQVVRFCEKTADFRFWDGMSWCPFLGFSSDDMEVVGNIFDDPEFEKKFGEIYREAQ